MMHIISQTREEKFAMFLELTKRELVEMLLNNQEAVERFQKQAQLSSVKCITMQQDLSLLIRNV